MYLPLICRSLLFATLLLVQTVHAGTSNYQSLAWPDLMPQSDIDALSNPPEYLNEIEDGSVEDTIANQFKQQISKASDLRYQEALQSTKVIEEMDGKKVKIPGFIVPLEFDDNQVVTKFFLVPFFGACIHVPPPPPNQIIYVDAPNGVELTALYDPFWISGTLNTTIVENDVATSAYAMTMDKIENYY